MLGFIAAIRAATPVHFFRAPQGMNRSGRIQNFQPETEAKLKDTEADEQAATATRDNENVMFLDPNYPSGFIEISCYIGPERLFLA
jgi:hypothetical protein